MPDTPTSSSSLGSGLTQKGPTTSGDLGSGPSVVLRSPEVKVGEIVVEELSIVEVEG